MGLGFDTYADKIVAEAKAILIENRDKLTEPIGWLKWQQGGQAEIWVTHITINHGIKKDRDPMTEVMFEIETDPTFPTHRDWTDEDPTLQAFVEANDLSDDAEEEILYWDLPGSILTQQLLLAGERLRDELIAEGFEFDPACVICCGDEDETDGWSSRPRDFSKWVTGDSLGAFEASLLPTLADLLFDHEANRTWFCGLKEN